MKAGCALGGIEKPPKQSTLACANERRPGELFHTVFQRLYQYCSVERLVRVKKKFRVKHQLPTQDAKLAPLCLPVFDWAQYRRFKGPVRLHLILDHDGCPPQFASLTPGKTHEIEAARSQPFEPGPMPLFDRGSADIAWWLELSRQKVFFVTRVKEDLGYSIVVQQPAPQGGMIVRDEVILPTKIQEGDP